MGKQRRLVRQQLIEAAIQRVLGDQPIILAQQIRHRALLEPLPMQAPLAAGIDQPIAHQRLQDVLPAGAFARIRQQRCKDPIQLQLLIEMTGQPACSPLARAMQLHRIEPHLYPKALGMIRHPLLGRKQGKLPMPPAPLVEPLDHPAPRRALTVVDLAQRQNRTLHHPTARTAPAFDNAPIPVLLAVLPSPCESQVHGPRFYAQTKIRKERRSSLHAFSPHRPLRRFSFFRQNSKIRGPVGKVGLASGTIYRWEFERRGKKVEIDVPGRVSLDDTSLMQEAALAGLGLAYLSAWQVASDVKAGRLVQVLDDWTPSFPGLCLYYPGRRHVPAGLRALIELIRESKAPR